MKTTYLLALIVAGTILIAGPSRAATDASINKEIFHLLMNNKSLAPGAEKMTATTHDGVVTLTGGVMTPEDKNALHKAIAELPGVQEVKDNQLILKSGDSPAQGFGQGLEN
ncbi:MAG TPA: BON domain-containing protein [Candidatus Baltobacteraceae bacterium]|nr:BON domain-containing protein [Candidatus Baltobacteraceae bacterium]